MTDIKKIIQCIVRDIEEVNKPPYLDKFNDAPNKIPGLIFTGDGGSLFVNRTIETNITKVADWYSNQRPELKKKCTTKEWRRAIRIIVGRSFNEFSPSDSLEQRGRYFKQLVESEIEEYLSRHNICFLSFGCSLFRDPLDSEYTIGPVTFFPVQLWLNKALNDQLIKNTEHQRLTAVSFGENSDLAKESLEGSTERQIYELLNGSQLVCTVETEGLAPELARERSLVAARLAQTAIALHWLQPSEILGGMHLTGDRGTQNIEIITYTPEAGLGWHWEIVRLNSVECNSIESFAGDRRSFYDLAGRMIACWTSSTEYSQASDLLRSLSQALYFFWRGCKDDDKLMSIVKFTASLEALAKRKNSSGILGLLKARFNMSEDDLITSDKTLKQMVKLIYNRARSRTLHGTNADLLHDWSSMETTAEIITRNCIVSSMYFLMENPDARELSC